MGSSSSVMRPQELVEFRKVNTSIDNIDIPARAHSRSLTDKKGFLLYGIALLILFPFLIYSLTKFDLRHLTRNADDCGDFCGDINQPISGVSCSGKNLIDNRYLQDGQCVQYCSGGRHSVGLKCVLETDQFIRSYGRFPRAIGSSFFDIRDDEFTKKDKLDFQNGLESSRREGWKFLITILITIGLSILVMVMLRFMPAPFVWAIIIFCILVLIIGIAGLWFLYFAVANNEETKDKASPLLVLALGWTIIALIVIIIIMCLFKKIGLVIQLYKETVKALAAMPMLVFIPVLVTLVQIIVLVAAGVTTFMLAFSRELYTVGEKHYYDFSGVIIFTLIYNIIITIWTMRFISGIQFMIISGSVSRWFFSRNKEYLDSPICTSTGITFRYHLGTLAFGSFILTLFSVVKAIIRSVCRNACCRCLVIMCCSSVEVVLNFLSENSYIETAIHGQSYLRSAKRATKLLLTNASSVIAINCVGDFVLGMIIFVVTIVATGISFTLFMNLGPLAVVATVICFWINLIIIAIMFGTFQTIIDTLFICFCEDSVINDGVSKPYFMSRGLMEFVENSKKLYGKGNGR